MRVILWSLWLPMIPFWISNVSGVIHYLNDFDKNRQEQWETQFEKVNQSDKYPTFKLSCIVTSSLMKLRTSSVNFSFNNGRNNSVRNLFSLAICLTLPSLFWAEGDDKSWSLSVFSTT